VRQGTMGQERQGDARWRDEHVIRRRWRRVRARDELRLGVWKIFGECELELISVHRFCEHCARTRFHECGNIFIQCVATAQQKNRATNV
jgi:hypothetical protein